MRYCQTLNDVSFEGWLVNVLFLLEDTSSAMHHQGIRDAQERYQEHLGIRYHALFHLR